MTDAAKTPTAVTIPDEVKTKFPELIELIMGSESMNDEERQYWINILPVMTPEQTQNLKDILINERDQLQAIDRKYAKEIERIGSDQLVEKIEEERRRRREERTKQESQAKEEETERAEDILGEIQGKK